MFFQQYFPYFVSFPFSCLFVWFPFFAKPGEIAPKKEQTSESKEQTNERTNEQTNEQTNERTNEGTNQRIEKKINFGFLRDSTKTNSVRAK
jgi:hypothetical protein